MTGRRSYRNHFSGSDDEYVRMLEFVSVVYPMVKMVSKEMYRADKPGAAQMAASKLINALDMNYELIGEYMSFGISDFEDDFDLDDYDWKSFCSPVWKAEAIMLGKEGYSDCVERMRAVCELLTEALRVIYVASYEDFWKLSKHRKGGR